MGKDRPKKLKEPTPFEKFDQLAKRIVRVPKRAIEENKKTQSSRPNAS